MRVPVCALQVARSFHGSDDSLPRDSHHDTSAGSGTDAYCAESKVGFGVVNIGVRGP